VVVPIGSVRKIAGLRGAGSLGGGVGTKIFKVTLTKFILCNFT
jgi:hypothetical protein